MSCGVVQDASSPAGQLEALSQFNNLVVMATDDNIGGLRSAPFVRVRAPRWYLCLCVCSHCGQLTNCTQQVIGPMLEAEDNPDVMLMAARALTNLLEVRRVPPPLCVRVTRALVVHYQVVPSSGNDVVREGIVQALCAKVLGRLSLSLFTIRCDTWTRCSWW